jgi:uroporphyrin-III C-methyltransferase
MNSGTLPFRSAKPPAIGQVCLVGAGPGDPDLLTLKAVKALAQADVVVHDRLIDMRVLDHAPSTARRIYVGKMRARHALPQDDINALLVAEALAGNRVVRLKGGDPFIFGRGGEEAEAARAAGVSVEVVPGISAANGAAAVAQLPLTHRDASSAIAFVTGHCKDGVEQDWTGLAGQGRTLVVYMGLTQAARIAQSLQDQGVSGSLPVAIIENATRSDQRTFLTQVDAMAAVIVSQGIASPALLVIGESAARMPSHVLTSIVTSTLLAAE